MRHAVPLLGFLIALTPPRSVQAQAALPPLSFLGFEAGASLEQIQHQVGALGGQALHCDRARRDRSVLECRTTVFEPGSGHPVELWLSAMDSAAGIMMLSSPVTGVQLDSWRSGLETAFGVVDGQVQGPQWMLQWVRQGRMLRLTWRIDNGAKVASVSLVDGQVLDRWGSHCCPVLKRRRASHDSAPASASTTGRAVEDSASPH